MATSLADIRSVAGLDDYLDALEERLARTVALSQRWSSPTVMTRFITS